MVASPPHSRCIVIAAALAAVLCITACGDRSPARDAARRGPAIGADRSATDAAWQEPDRSYSDILDSATATRRSLAERYGRAANARERAAVVDDARDAVGRLVHEALLPQWYGTAWDFNGTTQTPRTGAIACGYFVTTVLRDAGWNVQRARLAQQPSEAIIKSLVGEPNIRRFSNAALPDFVAGVRTMGAGLYVVGLDLHVGFLMNTGSEVFFIHSSYVGPRVVVSEPALTSVVLAGSRYRVVGRLTADDAFIVKWLTGAPIATRTA